jgi:hypothetical protein
VSFLLVSSDLFAGAEAGASAATGASVSAMISPVRLSRW